VLYSYYTIQANTLTKFTNSTEYKPNKWCTLNTISGNNAMENLFSFVWHLNHYTIPHLRSTYSDVNAYVTL